jgi:hypothetical protein
MDCNTCKNNCIYAKEKLEVPCDYCKYTECTSSDDVCNECITGKCQFEKDLEG